MFELEVDAQARSWLDSHPADAYVIAYDVHRGCGGGKLGEVRVRELSRGDTIDGHVSAALADGTRFLIDRSAAARLPSRCRLTVRCLARLNPRDRRRRPHAWADLRST